MATPQIVITKHLHWCFACKHYVSCLLGCAISSWKSPEHEGAALSFCPCCRPGTSEVTPENLAKAREMMH